MGGPERWPRGRGVCADDESESDEDGDLLLFRLGHAACTFPFHQPFISSLDSARSAPA